MFFHTVRHEYSNIIKTNTDSHEKNGFYTYVIACTSASTVRNNRLTIFSVSTVTGRYTTVVVNGSLLGFLAAVKAETLTNPIRKVTSLRLVSGRRTDALH
jgi:hypothetical protein